MAAQANKFNKLINIKGEINMNNKLVLATMVMATITGGAFANGIVVGQVEPNTTAPVVSGYNSAALGVNTVVTGTSTIVLGRDNKVSGNDTTVIGTNNGTVSANQTTIIGYNNKTNSNQEQVVIGANSETAGQGATVVGTHGKATAWDAYAIGNNTLADKSNSVALGTNSVTDNPVATQQVVLNGVTHVFAGENPQSVVSVGSKDRAGFGGVKYYNRQITNVAAGKEDTDAVNVAQVKSLARQTQSSLAAAESNHQTQIAALRNEAKVRMDKLEERADSGSAAAIAVGSLGQAYQPGQGAVSVASGIWRGKSGYAVGISKVSASGKWLVKGSAVGAAKGGAGGGASVTYLW